MKTSKATENDFCNAFGNAMLALHVEHAVYHYMGQLAGDEDGENPYGRWSFKKADNGAVYMVPRTGSDVEMKHLLYGKTFTLSPEAAGIAIMVHTLSHLSFQITDVRVLKVLGGLYYRLLDILNAHNEAGTIHALLD